MNDPFEEETGYENYVQNDYVAPFHGLRSYVAIAYICFNIIGLLVNVYVLYVVGPLLVAPQVKVPKAILFYIFVLCTSDILTLTGMFLLITELVFGSWIFSIYACVSYMFFDSMNKFVAPIIVVLISRTCYATVCLNKEQADRASSLKHAIPNIIAALIIVIVLLWPVFVYTKVTNVPIKVNHTLQEVFLSRKCGFMPPPKVQTGFNIIACISSYAIPLFGFIYWYMSVPWFLRKKRAETTLIRGSTSSNGGTSNIALRKVTATVLVLTIVYVSCWTPFWLMLFLIQFFVQDYMTNGLIITMYVVHLLPYISCCAYPLIFTIMNRAIQRAHSQMIETQRRRLKSLTVDLTRHIREAFNFRLLDRDNGLFPRSSLSVATTAQRIALSSTSSLHPPGFNASQSSASITNVLLESTSTNESLPDKSRRRQSAQELELEDTV